MSKDAEPSGKEAKESSAELVLGPLLRYVSETEATVWVETSRACEVEVLGRKERTFEVRGHHFALVCIDGLEPGSSSEYEVTLDGDRRWPPRDYEYPPPRIRTLDPKRGIDLYFGSCRIALPHERPYTLTRDQDDDGFELDALVVLARQMIEKGEETWPEVLLMLGDQVYVDEGSPRVRELIRSRRDPARPPGLEVSDWVEYTQLYLESWSLPEIRWLLATVSSSMILDDHDMSDDWNISRAWKEGREATDWWHERVIAGFMTYWLYQHLGNLSPDELAENEVFQRVREAEGDAGDIVQAYAEEADRNEEGVRWSFHRDLGRTRLIMMDSRAGRVLDEGERSMFDPPEGEWIGEMAKGDFDHLLLGTSIPLLMVHGAHYVEAWSEQVCAGKWGTFAARQCEKLRCAVDFDHWPSFMRSFDLIAETMRQVGSGEHGRAPASIVLLSGDIHHAYIAEVGFPRGSGVTASVYQAVCSPFRNPLDRKERASIRLLGSRPAHAIARRLARLAGVEDPAIRWRLTEGPYFNNQVASLRIRGREAWAKLEKTAGEDTDRYSLETSFERRIA